MLSQKTRYTIRALQYLADRGPGDPVQIQEISEKQNIPAKYLTVILSQMGREGYVGSRRGRDGGYWLAVDAAEIRIGDLIRLTRGSLALTPCSSRNNPKPCSNCVDMRVCRLRRLMLHVRDETAAVLDNVTLADQTFDLWAHDL